jgi:hypothetical protein
MTQSHALLRYLKTGREVTPLQALDRFGCFRLGARIYDLKRQGHAITSRRVRLGSKSFCAYRLAR